MKTSEVLNKAADAIERRGWATGGTDLDPWGYDGENTPVCLEGGIAAAMGMNQQQAHDDLLFCPAYRAVRSYLSDFFDPFDYEARLYLYNDATGRTSSEVIEVLRATAVIEAAREEATEKVAV